MDVVMRQDGTHSRYWCWLASWLALEGRMHSNWVKLLKRGPSWVGWEGFHLFFVYQHWNTYNTHSISTFRISTIDQFKSPLWQHLSTFKVIFSLSWTLSLSHPISLNHSKLSTHAMHDIWGKKEVDDGYLLHFWPTLPCYQNMFVFSVIKQQNAESKLGRCGFGKTNYDTYEYFQICMNVNRVCLKRIFPIKKS